MKKWISLTLVILLLFSLCGCRTGSGDITTAPQETADTAVDATIGYSEEFPEELKAYTSPWNFDVVAKAKAEGKMHYYFMSGKGMIMNPNSDQPQKWGDSTLIVFPDGQTMLVDSGVAAYAPLLVENLRRMGIMKLDYFLLSHPHSDHVNGAIADGGVFAELEVGQVYYCDYINNSLTKELLLVCKEKQVPAEALRKGDVKQFGEVTMEVLWPEKHAVAPDELTTEDINNGSLVMRFDFKEHSSLFTGDLYVKGEADLLADAAPGKLDADLLKVPHHSYTTSSSLEFVKAISPELAVAMGSPKSRDQTQNIFESNNAEYCHDSKDQYVHVVTDGKTIEYDTAWTRAKDQRK